MDDAEVAKVVGADGTATFMIVGAVTNLGADVVARIVVSADVASPASHDSAEAASVRCVGCDQISDNFEGDA